MNKLLKSSVAALVVATTLPSAPLLAQSGISTNITGTPRARVVLADRIVAVVNDDVITASELAERVRVVKSQLRRQNVPLPPEDVLEKQVLERAIVDRAQLQFGRENGLRVDDAQLDRAVARIAEDNKLSLSQFRDTLERDGIPFAKFREDIRNDIVINRVREREVDARLTITEGEIDNFISENNRVSGIGGEELNLVHILVRVPENASPEQLNERRKRAEDALAQLKGGGDFARTSAAFSDAPEALNGGAMGFRADSRLPQLFVDAVAKLKNGETSEIFKSPNGFHILRLVERRTAGAKVAVTQTKARHILIRTNEIVSQDQARRRLTDLRERLANKADFAELARLHSNDGSARNGGDLGWVYPGDTVPEFEKVMNELKPGDVSEPFQSQFGWHLLQVMERRNEDMSQERIRLSARQALRERKADEAYQEWLRQLRDRAFVEIRLDDR